MSVVYGHRNSIVRSDIGVRGIFELWINGEYINNDRIQWITGTLHMFAVLPEQYPLGTMMRVIHIFHKHVVITDGAVQVVDIRSDIGLDGIHASQISTDVDSDEEILEKFKDIAPYCYRVYEKFPTFCNEQSDFLILDNTGYVRSLVNSGWGT